MGGTSMAINSSGNANKFISIDNGSSAKRYCCGDGDKIIPSSCLARQVNVTDAGDAVIVRRAEKSYKSGQPVLNGLDMTVPCGSIYGLLGSSGCGKTTLLSCIVGQQKLDHGNIWIFGKKPGTRSIGVPGRNIGYMPQDIALYVEFSIDETLTYFGTLSGMTKEQIKYGKQFLMHLLGLPEECRKVESLSGGQQRRVSFAVALIHEPELLILDEPTVDVDPELRKNIWKYLRELVSSKRTTVLITTHYIEECRQADNIGVMRNGRLLAEREPNELLAEHGDAHLETVVLKLCKKDAQIKFNQENFGNSKYEDENNIHVRMASVINETKPTITDSLTRIKALTQKNFVILLRNPLLLFFVLLISSVMLTIMCTAFGSEPTRLNLGLINYEVNCSNIPTTFDGCSLEHLSCDLLLKIPKEVLQLKVYQNETDAITDTKKGNVWVYMTIPVNFSTSLVQRNAFGLTIDDEVFNASQINVRLDETSKIIGAAIKVILHTAFENFTKTLLQDCGIDPRQADYPLQYAEPLVGKSGIEFREYIISSTISPLLYFFPIITTSIRIIKERKNGVLDRSFIGGVRTWEIFAAFFISESCVLLCQSLINYFVVTILFKVEILGSSMLILFISLLSGYGGISMGCLLGSICSEEIQAAMLSMALFFPNAVLSGLLWPVEGMVKSLQYIVQVLPCTLLCESVRSIISRGWEFSHPNVWPGIVIMGIHTLACFLFTVVFHVAIKK